MAVPLSTLRRRDQPVAFTGPGPRKYQATILQGLIVDIASFPGHTFTVMLPRQAGKNEIAAMLVAELLRANAAAGGTVVVCAPTFTPQGLISFERTRRLLDLTGHAVEEPSQPGTATIRFGRASAIFLSASPEAHVAGHTASLCLIADEAQDIEADWFNRQFRPMAASTGAATVLFGTPWDGQTLLEQTAARNRARDASLGGDPFHDYFPFHLQSDWGTVERSNARFGDYVRGERARLGEDHPLFVTQYELRTVEDADRLLSPLQLARLEGSHTALHAPLPDERYAAGLDLAGQGERADRTVLTIARVRGPRCEVVRHVSWRSAPFGTVIAGVSEVAREWRIGRLCADATGMGGPIVAQLSEALGSRVEPFVFSSGSKSELGFGLLAAIDTGRLSLAADDGSREARDCREELRACRSHLQGHGVLHWEAPSGGHDDYVASLALCLRAAQGLPAPRVARGIRR